MTRSTFYFLLVTFVVSGPFGLFDGNHTATLIAQDESEFIQLLDIRTRDNRLHVTPRVFREWHRLAVDEGNAQAQYNIGLAWVSGQALQEEENNGFVGVTRANDWVTPEVDWVQWQDVAVEYVDLPDKINSADVVTIKKLFTTHVRKDRFCEGHLAAMFKNGHIVALLRRLKEIRETTPDTTEERNEVRRAKTLKAQLEALRERC